MITIKDIAKKANVSPATVSKALNARHDVSPKTKKRILKIAEEFDFVPNAFGKNLKNKRTENIGVIFCRDIHPISANPFYSRVLEGVEAETAINNHNLMLQFVTEEQTNGVPKMLKERQIDGIILIGSMTKEYIELIKSRNTPFVLIDPKFEVENCNQIVMDNEHGAFLATQYLIKNGHKDIGFISGDLHRLSFNQRYKGYLKAMQHLGLPVNKDFVSIGGVEQGYELAKNLLEKDVRPTAIFSANDINAHYGYRAAHDLGLSVPKDISFMGFDDIDLSHMISPALTTIRAYKEELGSIAVRTLLKNIDDPELKHSTNIIPIKLIERDSVLNVSK